jgi:hypothetical protein
MPFWSQNSCSLSVPLDQGSLIGPRNRLIPRTSRFGQTDSHVSFASLGSGLSQCETLALCAHCRTRDQIVLPELMTNLNTFNSIVTKSYPTQPPNAKAYHIIKLPAIMKKQYGTTIFNGRPLPAISHIGKMKEKYLKYDSSGGPENSKIER